MGPKVSWPLHSPDELVRGQIMCSDPISSPKRARAVWKCALTPALSPSPAPGLGQEADQKNRAGVRVCTQLGLRTSLREGKEQDWAGGGG